MGLVFIGGVHGVGKSTLCAEVGAKTALQVNSASSVIRAEKGRVVPDQSKAVADVDGNQHFLIAGVRKLLEQSPDIQLLDGHFALRSTTGSIECIGVRVFEQLGIRCVVCIQDAPAAIQSRLMQRDAHSCSLEEINALQEAELRHAGFVAEHLGLQLHVISAFDAVSLELVVRRAAAASGT